MAELQRLIFSASNWFLLSNEQRCPTLSPIATCDDRQFKCGNKHNFFNFMFIAIFKILNNMSKKRSVIETLQL